MADKDEVFISLFERAREQLQTPRYSKKDIIKQLAIDLESYGMLTEMISEEIANALEDYNLSRGYIRNCLDIKYKRKYQKNIREDIAHMCDIVATTGKVSITSNTDVKKHPEEAYRKIKELESNTRFLKGQLDEKDKRIKELTDLVPDTNVNTYNNEEDYNWFRKQVAVPLYFKGILNLKGLQQYVAKNGAVLVTGIIDMNSGRVIKFQAEKCKAIADDATVLYVDRKM